MADKIIENNRELLFIYDAKLTNPNGDPDDENRPRMDVATSRNLVSDVRLKRYIRDYLRDYKSKELFVTPVGDKIVNSTVRLKYLFLTHRKDNPLEPDKITDDDLKAVTSDSLKGLKKEELLEWLIDVRLFGATMTIREEARGQGGESFTFTGPVQFSWGYSLNPVEINRSAAITSRFSSTEEKGQGSIGKDWRVLYSVIAFYGSVSAKRAKHTKLTEADLELLEEAMLKFPLMATTRSKTGQTPRLLLSVEYNGPEYLLGDLREFVELAPKDGDKELREVRDINEVKLDCTRLWERLNNNPKKIAKIRMWNHPHLALQPGIPEDLSKEDISIKDEKQDA